jgi:hypothetical protein
MNRLTQWAALLSLALLSLLFLAPGLRPGKVLLPLDLVTQAWPPWQQPDQVVNVHNPLISDVVDYIYPVKAFAAEQVKGGTLPLWNPYVLGGYPLTYNTQAALFYPLSLFYYLLPPATAVNLTILIQLLLGGLFMFAYLRQMGLRALAAWVGAVVFLFNGMMVVWLEWQVVHAAVIWLPLYLLCIERIHMKLAQQPDNIWRTLPETAVAAFAFAMPWLGGHWNWALYSSMTAVLYSAYSVFRSPLSVVRKPLSVSRIPYSVSRSRLTAHVSRFTPHALPLLLGVGLSLIQVLPAFNYLRQGHRAPFSFTESLSLGLKEWAVVALVPDFFGNPIHANWWGRTNYNEVTFYAGLLPLFLAALALALRWRHGLTRFYAIWGGMGLLWALGTPLYGLLYILPVFNGLWPSRAMPVYLFALAVLSAIGLDALLAEKLNVRRVRQTATALALLIAATVAAYLLYYRPDLAVLRPDLLWFALSLFVSVSLIWALSVIRYPLSVIRNRFTALGSRLSAHGSRLTVHGSRLTVHGSRLTAHGLRLTAHGSRFTAHGSRLTAHGSRFTAHGSRLTAHGLRFTAVLLALWLAFDLYWLGRDYNPVGDTANLYPLTETSVFLQTDAEPFRITTLPEGVAYPPNTALAHRLPNLSGYEPAILQNVVDYLAAAEGSEAIYFERKLMPLRGLDSPLLAALNVKYVVTIADWYQEVSTLGAAQEPAAQSLQGEWVTLREETAVAQSFIVPDAGLHRLDLPLHVGLGADGAITVRVFTADGGQELANAHWAVGQPLADGWASFYFGAFPSEWGREFLFTVVYEGAGDAAIATAAAGIAYRSYYLPRPQLVHEAGKTRIYLNEGYFPRAYVVGQALSAADAAEALALAQTVDLRDMVVLEVGNRPPPVWQTAVSPASQVAIVEYAPNRVKLQADLEDAAFVVLADVYYPGWRATIDGQPTPLYRANSLVRALYVPAGRHAINLTFLPLDFAAGAALSLLTLLIIVGLSLYGWRYRSGQAQRRNP